MAAADQNGHDQDQQSDHLDPNLGQNLSPTKTKRTRWATQRVTGRNANKKRVSIMERFGRTPSEKKRDSGGAESTVTSHEDVTAPSEVGTETGEGGAPRRLYFNSPLPQEMIDENGRPKTHYVRNKVRTAKYTPISFIPKNLWYQFHNIANVYFLFLIILTIFSIFGNYDPALNAVPLIVIVCITAIKDAIEDSRRTMLDNELNNSPVHRLVNWSNVNISTDDISLWRRLKKATSRMMLQIWRWMKRIFMKKNNDGETEDKGHMPRPSFETGVTRRQSAYSIQTHRTSFMSAREDIQMTPVASPLSRDDETTNGFGASIDQKLQQRTPHDSGSLLNPFKPVGDAKFHKDFWKNVQVGDFVRIYNDDQIPADVVVLATSDPEGACYVETKNLDGETNLKLRHALRCGRDLKHARDCERSEFIIESEAPQPNLYQYSGVVKWNNKNRKDLEAEGEDMAEPISINNLLLRGCNLRNTEWALAVVIFTGFDTKIMLNSGITPTKRSRISRELNWNVIYNFVILLIMCIACGLVEGFTWGEGNNSLDWFEFGSFGGTAALNGFITFWAAIILFQNLIPISLFISLEIIRTAQAYFIYSDLHMYYDKLDYPCTPKSWNISDDLGQIEYIFSDKTGTLTQNVMEFKKATVNGIPYGEAYTEAQAGMQRRQGIDVEKEAARANQEIEAARVRMLEELRKLYNNPYLHDEDVTFIAPDYVTDLHGESGEEQKLANERFMLALSLCHSVVSEKVPGDPPKIEFKAQSPDEAALVATARDMGFTVLDNSQNGIRLNVQGDERTYEVLTTLEFNSTRKRMSAIIRMPDGQIVLFCKGADSIIYSRLKQGEQAELRRTTAEHLEMFAREGLRTLCIAQRNLTEEEYSDWSRRHEAAAAAIEHREDRLEEVSDEIERELTLLGGTAIEDRLQEGVPDTIALLAQAGIKLWVLTGDKVETAINIGFSCNLLNNDMELIILKVEDEQLSTAEAVLDKHLATFNMTGSDEELKAARKSHAAPAPTHALIIDGDTLKLVLEDQLKQKFLLLCKQCKSVLCCRVSPAQKAAVVQMVKNGLDVMTLSIGDGANDVAMIQQADVGVGIAGEEGRQAVMSSDYAIGQFRFLQRLVLVHGRWSYRRVGEMIANFFYKNIVWTFAIFWYQIYANFDQTYLYDYSYILLFNLAFTSIPVIFMGVLDQDVSDAVSLAVPQLYMRGIERKEWTQSKFWLYMLDGLYQSVICFFMAYLQFAPGNFSSKSGQDVGDSERLGLYIAPATIFVVNTYILLNTYRWDWLIVLLTSISTLLIWFWSGVYSSFESSGVLYEAASQVFGQATFWGVTCLTIVASLLPRFMIKSLQKVYFPYDVDIIREQVRLGKFKELEAAYAIPADEKKKKKKKQKKSKDMKFGSFSSSESSALPKPSQPPIDDDRRPIYPPSVAYTATTHNARSQNGSDGTDFTRHRASVDMPTNIRLSLDRPRPSYERTRQSMDKLRPSFEASRDFTSAALLSRIESSQSHGISHSRSRTQDITQDIIGESR